MTNTPTIPQPNHSRPIPFAFFGSSRFSTIALDELEKMGFAPSLIVTTPDKPQGRKMTLTPTPVKTWATKRNIPVLDTAKLDALFIKKLQEATLAKKVEVFVVASYGKIIPESVLDIPKHKTLNIHPSLLPKYRGASPLQSAMLDDAKDTGVTIMKVDAQMDHGSIVAQEKIHVDEWPIYEDFETIMAQKGADLLAETLPKWINGEIKAKPQEHNSATFTKKIKKENGLLHGNFLIGHDLRIGNHLHNGNKPHTGGVNDAGGNDDAGDASGNAYLAFRKIQAFHEWPQAYFFIEHKIGNEIKNIRVKITEAEFRKSNTNEDGRGKGVISGTLVIKKVIPEGSKEMGYEDFIRGYKQLND
jgi:methionyl-tRNA formyltransferase